MSQQLKSILLQKKGLTLMEVLIVMGLIGIISVPLTQIFFSGQKQFVTHQNALNEKSRCMLLQEKIKDEVLLAKSIRFLEENTLISLQEGEMAIYLVEKDSGYYELVKQIANTKQVILSQDYLKTNHITLNFNLKVYGQKALEIVVSEENYQTDTAFQLPNLKINENSEEMQGQVLIYTK